MLEVDTRAPNAAEPQWTRVNGLTSFSETTDDNTEDDAALRTWSIEAEGRRKRTDATAFTPDPGEEAIRKAGRVVGFAANVSVRWYRRDWAPLTKAPQRFPGSPRVAAPRTWSRSTSP